jgi:OOP family OmpA-OmpF porin
LKLLVVGHTDNVGTFEFNRVLSWLHAKAVVDELTAQYGVSAERLFPFGVSFASPVASNETDQGRTKNRRVELVKIYKASFWPHVSSIL